MMIRQYVITKEIRMRTRGELQVILQNVVLARSAFMELHLHFSLNG